MKRLRCASAFAAALVLSTMKLSADDSSRFDFLTDNAKLLTPIQIIAPDSWASKNEHNFALLVQINQGNVQSVEEIGGLANVPEHVVESLKSWKFDKGASGQFLLLYKAAQKLPQAVFPYESLDNKPIPLAKALPSYPHLLRTVVSWRATVEAIIGEDGVPVAATVLSSTNSDYNNNACLAALLYRFEVGSKDGKHVSYKTRIDVCFDATAE